MNPIIREMIFLSRPVRKQMKPFLETPVHANQTNLSFLVVTPCFNGVSEPVGHVIHPHIVTELAP